MRRRLDATGEWSLSSLPDWYVLQTLPDGTRLSALYRAADGSTLRGTRVTEWLQARRDFRDVLAAAGVRFGYADLQAERERRLERRGQVTRA